MRKIEQEMMDAIAWHKDWASGNTAVWYISANESGNPHGARSSIYLHNNHIADYWHNTQEIEVNTRTLRDWPTSTTKSRLRALGADIKTKNGKVYWNGMEV